MNKKVKEAILDIMADTPNISKGEVVELIKKYDDAIDVNRLIEKELSTRATRLMATFKDERGIRDIFTITNNEDSSEYVNITRSRELEDLAKVQKRLEGNIKGNSVSLEKVKSRIFLIKNQLSVFDVKEAKS